MSFEIVSCLALNDSLACNFLTPIAQHPLVSRIWVVRAERIQCHNEQKIEYILVPTHFKPWRFIQMMWICFRLARKKEVAAFVSFNPIPYGLLELLGAKWFKKPIHFGFIGDDWNTYTKRWGRWLLPIFRQIEFITVTGESMRQEMLEHQIKETRVTVLPHSIDLNQYHIADPETAQYTCIFVGYLLPGKRVDLILRAFSEVHKSHPEARFCIVGHGPLAEELRDLASELGIASVVDFAGFVPEVPPYLANAKIFVMASDNEGLPFAIIESICCGLVPVSSAVGTIGDLIVNEKNGLLFPRNDWRMLAQCIQRLLDEPELYERLRAEVLQLRQNFAYDSATVVWDKWLSNLAEARKRSKTDIQTGESRH